MRLVGRISLALKRKKAEAAVRKYKRAAARIIKEAKKEREPP